MRKILRCVRNQLSVCLAPRSFALGLHGSLIYHLLSVCARSFPISGRSVCSPISTFSRPQPALAALPSSSSSSTSSTSMEPSDLLPFSLFTATVATFCLLKGHVRHSSSPRQSAYDQLIGSTPLIRLHKLSEITKRTIMLKMESSNPGQTGKDRAVKHILDSAEEAGLLKKGMAVVEGTSGSTGISLAYQCRARGYQLHVVMPDDQAEEKRILLEKLGAKVLVVPVCSIANKNHYVNRARSLAQELGGFFVNQFENTANQQAHYLRTGPELWAQTGGRIDGFVMSAGTGGTIAGISRFLKERDRRIRVLLADPTGSSLCNKVNHDVCYTRQQSERTIRKHRYDSIVEGVGLDRITANFAAARIDAAYQAEDQRLVVLAHWLLRHEGLLLGSSTALNLAVLLQALPQFPEAAVLVTVCCDSGQRHLSRFWSPAFLASQGLRWPQSEEELEADFSRLFLREIQ